MRIFGSLHLVDLLVIVAYLATVVYIGKRAAKGTSSEEGFFLAGRSLGKLYQFFLNFGNATEPQGAVSTASLVFQRGVTGVWFSFQTVFMNPYFWFMNTWFRRVRLVTAADLFEDRFGSRGLSRLYALFQVVVACVFLGFGNYVAYKIASSLVVKPEAQWTASDRSSVEDYRELKVLEKQVSAGTLAEEVKPRLATLRDRQARGELASYVTLLRSLPFYLGFTLVVGAYIVLGGMAAAAVNEALQSVLIIVFSILLIPTGLAAIGGWGEIAHKVPGQMLDLFAGPGGSVTFIAAVLFISIVQNGGLSHNMGIAGSAKNEFAARMGVTGNYLKRFMIILWAFAGIIAIALFGVGGLADPDIVWGAMSNKLLGPGLIGLMLAGVLAGTMSTLAAKALAISSLFVRNFYRHLRPDATQGQAVTAARWTIVIVLALGVLSAELMGDVESIVKLVLTVNVPFGAAILTSFFWRRLTAKAVWWSVSLTVIAILFIPNIAADLKPLRTAPSLAAMSTSADGKPVPVYWKQLVRTYPADPNSPLEGKGRFNFECWVLNKLGLDVAKLAPQSREAATFYFDGAFPFLVLLLVSYLTRPTDQARVDLFYGKMKTPVGATPELEAAAMEETRRNPGRFDHTKLFRHSTWEFCKWDRVDAIGFIICCAVSGAIIGLFVLLLKWAA
jgi:SSS family solute:Na+ symporter